MRRSASLFLHLDKGLMLHHQCLAYLELIKIIGLFGINVMDAANNLSPKVIARYCYDLAVSFNSFYEHVKVLGIGDEKLEKSRLCLVNSFKMTLVKSLNLLGITAPERM